MDEAAGLIKISGVAFGAAEPMVTLEGVPVVEGVLLRATARDGEGRSTTTAIGFYSLGDKVRNARGLSPSVTFVA